MVLPKESFIPPPEGPRARLGAADLPALQVLFEGQPDLPDAFDPSQLQDGIFYGVWEDDRLVAVAGTHVVSPEASVAAIGNVYTRRDRRGRGLGRRTTGAVAAELLASGVVTIVLNVAMDNEPALAVYRALGFMPFCGYYEGVGELAPAASNPKET
jgi:ribosomal protein S18 acetylase RimI-like enzyme